MINENETLNQYAKRLLAEIKRYKIRVTDIDKGTNLSRSTVHSFYHQDKRTNKGNLDIIDAFIQKEYRDKDINLQPLISIGGFVVSELDFIDTFLKSLPKLRKHSQLQYYEADLKKQAIIEYLENKEKE